MPVRAAVRAEAARLQQAFLAAGANPVEADILQPADTLLDLYGEDIRARAYVTSDPLVGEMMLRPDFTVPVVQMQVESGAEPARFTYLGEVFRKQEHETGRPSEYMQVGFELFDGTDPAASDAEVFALFSQLLAPLGLRAATGDIGILLAAIHGLNTTDKRKNALLRHLWRPRRFRTLLDRFAGRRKPSDYRRALLDKLTTTERSDLVDGAGPAIGLRSVGEVESRLTTLMEDSQVPPLSQGEVEIIEAILGLQETAGNALEALRDFAVDLRALQPAVERFEARLAALDAKGIDAAALDFEASYGRTTMEYYDGFVFGFYAPSRPDLPPVASGGRYDALCRILGKERAVPAVGGVIRPELTLLTAGGLA